ncbi:hypothetical protein FPQ18DRAFT_347810 [Pyronema domesticum]|nr:hypothetical protein FPQ18DRAFT_347810 [Pyronema domesticum]
MEMRTQCPCRTLSQAPFDAHVTHSKAEIEGLHQQSFGGHPQAPPNDTIGRATSRHYSDYRTPESQVTVPPFANSNDDAVRNDNPTPNPLRLELTFAPVENNNNPESRITHMIQITCPEGIETEYRGARQQLRTGEDIPVAAARSGRHEWNPTVYTDRYDRHLNLPQAFYSDYQQCFTKCDELLEQLKSSQSETHSEAHEKLTEDIQRRMLEKDWIELRFLYSKMHELLDILDQLSNALLSS